MTKKDIVDELLNIRLSLTKLYGINDTTVYHVTKVLEVLEEIKDDGVSNAQEVSEPTVKTKEMRDIE